MKDYPLYVCVGKRYAFVPEASSVIVKDRVGRIIGGKYDGLEIKGVTGASVSASFFSKHKGYQEVTLSELLEEKK